jgi:hypothetical protein
MRHNFLSCSTLMPKYLSAVFAHTPADARMCLSRLGGRLSPSISLAASVALNGWSTPTDRRVNLFISHP